MTIKDFIQNVNPDETPTAVLPDSFVPGMIHPHAGHLDPTADPNAAGAEEAAAAEGGEEPVFEAEQQQAEEVREEAQERVEEEEEAAEVREEEQEQAEEVKEEEQEEAEEIREEEQEQAEEIQEERQMDEIKEEEEEVQQEHDPLLHHEHHHEHNVIHNTAGSMLLTQQQMMQTPLRNFGCKSLSGTTSAMAKKIIPLSQPATITMPLSAMHATPAYRLQQEKVRKPVIYASINRAGVPPKPALAPRKSTSVTIHMGFDQGKLGYLATYNHNIHDENTMNIKNLLLTSLFLGKWRLNWVTKMYYMQVFFMIWRVLYMLSYMQK